MATGWLVRSNLVVTAGHCSFDHSHELGRLTHVKAYIGYHGNESIDDPSYAVQFLTAKSVATTQSWLQDGSNEAADVSFILLDGSFGRLSALRKLLAKWWSPHFKRADRNNKSTFLEYAGLYRG